jgi:hypothetical protein
MMMLRKMTAKLLLLAAGFVVGYLVACAGWYTSSKKAMARFQSIGLTEMANDVHQLQQGNVDAVLARKQEALPRLTQRYYATFLRSLPEEQRNGVLWAVSRCYEAPGREPPALIKPILDALPPRPPTSCELKSLPATGAPEDQEREAEPAAAP